MQNIKRLILVVSFLFISLTMFALPKIMITGFWDPTGQMLTKFNNNPELNPDGWQGANWEGLGYDVYAFYPEPGTYLGDFEVDYQDTWEDFWAITDTLQPCAIISYGAGTGPWEIEYNARNLSSWYADYVSPYYPTPNPPDDTVPTNYVRHSTLPVQAIADAVNWETDLDAWVDWNGNPGKFLCEYLAYLGMWYQDMHSDYEDPALCQAAGFIHVASDVAVEDAAVAADITLREVIKYISSFVDLEGIVDAGGVDLTGAVINFSGEKNYTVVIDNAEGGFSLPNIPSGTYQVTAFLDRYYFLNQEITVDSNNTFAKLTLEEYPYVDPISYGDQPQQLYDVGLSDNVEIASMFSPDELQNHVGDVLGKVAFKTPTSSDSCDITLKLYSGSKTSGPDQLVYECVLDDFAADQWLEHTITAPIIIEEGQEYWVGYEIFTQNGKVAWMDNGPQVEGKGGWYKENYWKELSETNANWMIQATVYSPDPFSGTNESVIAAGSSKLGNYPNPFNPSTTIRYSLAADETVSLEIFNVKGQKVTTLVNGSQTAGDHNVLWNGRDNSGKPVASGIYFCRLKTNSSCQTGKMLLMK